MRNWLNVPSLVKRWKISIVWPCLCYQEPPLIKLPIEHLPSCPHQRATGCWHCVDPSKLWSWDTESFSEMKFPYPVPEQHEPVKPPFLTWCFPCPSRCHAYDTYDPKCPPWRPLIIIFLIFPGSIHDPAISATLQHLTQHCSQRTCLGIL